MGRIFVLGFRSVGALVVFTPIPAFPRRGGRGVCPHPNPLPEGEGTLACVCIRGGMPFDRLRANGDGV